MKHMYLLLAVLFLSTSVYAFHCPADAAAIDAGLAKVSLSDEVKSKIIELRDKGFEQHQAGNHAMSVSTLSEAMRILINEME